VVFKYGGKKKIDHKIAASKSDYLRQSVVILPKAKSETH
jgi:hypothetical protein